MTPEERLKQTEILLKTAAKYINLLSQSGNGQSRD